MRIPFKWDKSKVNSVSKLPGHTVRPKTKSHGIRTTCPNGGLFDPILSSILISWVRRKCHFKIPYNFFFPKLLGGKGESIIYSFYITFFFGVRKYSSIRRYTYLHKALGGEHDSKHTGVSKPNSCIRIPLFSLPGESRDEEKKEFRMRTCMTSQITGPNTRLNLSKRKKYIYSVEYIISQPKKKINPTIPPLLFRERRKSLDMQVVRDVVSWTWHDPPLLLYDQDESHCLENTQMALCNVPARWLIQALNKHKSSMTQESEAPVREF